MTFIDRPVVVKRIHDALAEYPVTLLLGPRQCGKTTIARAFHKANGGAYFDLEDPEAPLKPEIAKQVLKDLKGLIVIDEFQRQPELFPLVRVLVDREDNPARFLILGSASTELVRGVSESLAGRVAYVDMSGFSMDEVGATTCGYGEVSRMLSLQKTMIRAINGDSTSSPHFLKETFRS
jgi:predicted AAA+ superfamily ATPase